MIEFRTALQNQMLTLIQGWVGASSGFTPPVITFDNHLHDVPIEALPFVVVNVRTTDLEDEEIAPYDTYRWLVHVYYLDIKPDYNTGDIARNKILGEIVKRLEENKRIGNLEQVDVPTGKREYVWDSKITSALFDSSGQEEYYTFVSELYLDVYTSKT